jgi:hypothetical protein
MSSFRLALRLHYLRHHPLSLPLSTPTLLDIFTLDAASHAGTSLRPVLSRSFFFVVRREREQGRCQLSDSNANFLTLAMEAVMHIQCWNFYVCEH